MERWIGRSRPRTHCRSDVRLADFRSLREGVGRPTPSPRQLRPHMTHGQQKRPHPLINRSTCKEASAMKGAVRSHSASRMWSRGKLLRDWRELWGTA